MSLVPLGWSREIWHGGLGVGPIEPVRPSSNLSQSGSCGKRDCLGRWLSSRSNGWNWWLYSINTPSPFSFRGSRIFQCYRIAVTGTFKTIEIAYSSSLFHVPLDHLFYVSSYVTPFGLHEARYSRSTHVITQRTPHLHLATPLGKARGRWYLTMVNTRKNPANTEDTSR